MVSFSLYNNGNPCSWPQASWHYGRSCETRDQLIEDAGIGLVTKHQQIREILEIG